MEKIETKEWNITQLFVARVLGNKKLLEIRMGYHYLILRDVIFLAIFSFYARGCHKKIRFFSKKIVHL